MARPDESVGAVYGEVNEGEKEDVDRPRITTRRTPSIF